MNFLEIVLGIYLGGILIVALIVWVFVLLRRNYNMKPVDVGVSLYEESYSKEDRLRNFVYEFPKVSDVDLIDDKKKQKEVIALFDEYEKKHRKWKEVVPDEGKRNKLEKVGKGFFAGTHGSSYTVVVDSNNAF